ncbi:MAG: cupin domain-containing protein [Bacteroidia bacterium]
MIEKKILEQLDFNKVKIKKIAHTEKFDCVLLTIEEGNILKEHISNTDSYLIVLSGEINFNINNQSFRLTQSDGIAFAKNIPHSVEALSNSKLLLIK